MNRTLPSEELASIARFDISSVYKDDIGVFDIHKGIIDFYRNYSDLSVLSFELSSRDNTHRVDSVFISNDETRNQLEGLCFEENFQTVIESDLNILDDLVNADVFSEEYYNNTKIALEIDDGKIRPVKTDYYTSAILSEFLRIESGIAGKKKQTTIEDYPVRREVIGDKDDFLSPSRPLVGSSRGIICTKRPDETYCIILGKRADHLDSAPDYISTFPAGTIEEYGKMDPSKTMKREFIEEFFVDSPKIGLNVLQKSRIQLISSGWNGRSGGMIFDYIISSEDPQVYENIVEHRSGNGEIKELIEIPIQDFNKLSNIVSLEHMNADAVHSVCYTLMYIDESSNFPDLSYDISSEWV